MPWLHAHLKDQPTGTSRRLLNYRLKDCMEDVPETVRNLPAGAHVLLDGWPDHWGSGQALPQVSTWPGYLPPPAVLREHRGPQPVHLRLEPVKTGDYAEDADGRACEIATIKLGGREQAILISYAGWRLNDLEGQELPFYVVTLQDRVVYVLSARGVPDPPAAGWAKEPVSPSGVPRVGGATRGTDPPSFIAVDARVPVMKLEWRDGIIEVPVVRLLSNRPPWPGFPRRIEMRAPGARAAFDALKKDLHRHMPDGVRVHGSLGRDGSHELEVEGMEDLERIFREVAATKFIGVARREGRVLDLRGVLERMGHGHRAVTPEDLADRVGFQKDRRREAFLRLFRLWNERDQVLLFTTNGSFMVSVDAHDGNPPWRLWEKPDEGATYLFRPGGPDLERLVAWLGSEDFSRSDLLRKPAMQDAFGFRDRVFHRDGDRELAAWWHDLVDRIGRARR